MDTTRLGTEDTRLWGVVYSYGSVLAMFDNEQDAQDEATSFNGAVVRIARDVWTAFCEASTSVECR
jgi:hypothetical protein